MRVTIEKQLTREPKIMNRESIFMNWYPVVVTVHVANAGLLLLSVV
jgi:hypothetical protein